MSDERLPQRWLLEHRGIGSSLEIALSGDRVLVVVSKQRGKEPKREEKTLKTHDAAMAIVKKLMDERLARDFKVTAEESDETRRRDAWNAKWQAEQAAAALVPVDPIADVVEAGASTDAGWLALDACAVAGLEGDRAAALDERVAAHDTVQFLVDSGDDDAPPASAIAWLCKTARPSVRALILDTHWQTPTRQLDDEYGVHWGALDDVFTALPNLELLYVLGAFSLQPVKHAKLLSLTIVTRSIGKTLCQALAKSALPQLTSLGLCTGGEEHAADDDDLVALFAGGAHKGVVDVDVGGCADPVAVVEACKGRGLRNLYVEGAAVDDEDDALPRLLAVAAHYADADVALELDTFSESALATLTAAWPKLAVEGAGPLFLPSSYVGARNALLTQK